MKKLVLVSAVAGALSLPLAGHAAEAPAHSFTGNVGVFSNYIFRGVTQTSEEAALQGGFDYGHASGAYAGIWGSNVSWLSDSTAYNGSSVELDLYGGYKGTFGKSDFGYDVGAIYYYYPGDKTTANDANTAEVYGALSWKWLSAKLSWAVTDYFGLYDSKNSYYVDVSANYPVGNSGVTLIAHYGFLKLEGNTAAGATTSNDDTYGYSDWKLGASYALPQNFVVGAVYTDTDAEHANYTVNGKKWSDGQFAIYLQKTF